MLSRPDFKRSIECAAQKANLGEMRHGCRTEPTRRQSAGCEGTRRANWLGCIFLVTSFVQAKEVTRQQAKNGFSKTEKTSVNKLQLLISQMKRIPFKQKNEVLNPASFRQGLPESRSQGRDAAHLPWTLGPGNLCRDDGNAGKLRPLSAFVGPNLFGQWSV